MKTYINYLFFILAFVFATTACDREKIDYDNGEENKEGTLELSLSFSLTVEIDGASTYAQSAKASSINVENFIIRIYNKENETLTKEWAYNKVPEIVSLKTGNYRIEAHSRDLDLTSISSEAYYLGTKDFLIEENKITQIGSITCTRHDIKVEIGLTDNLKQKLDDGYKASVSIGAVEYVYTQSSFGTAIHFPSQTDENTLIVVMEGSIDGEPIYSRKVYSGVIRGEYRRVTFELKDNGVDENDEGQMDKLSFKVDATCVIITNNINIPAEETPLDPGTTDPGTTNPGEEDDPITIVGQGFDIEQSQFIPNGGTNIVVVITAESGIKNLHVNIDSSILDEEELGGIGLAPNFDLANPGELATALGTIGFPVGNEVIGKTRLNFDISEFTDLLKKLGSGTHKFRLTVIDRNNNQLVKTLTLTT